jgi:3-dehydroquinate dehydratase-2
LKVREALRNCGVGVVEVHISNINAREPWRAHSMVSGVVRGSIIGLGVSGYPLAIEAIAGSG